MAYVGQVLGFHLCIGTYRSTSRNLLGCMIDWELLAWGSKLATPFDCDASSCLHRLWDKSSFGHLQETAAAESHVGAFMWSGY